MQMLREFPEVTWEVFSRVGASLPHKVTSSCPHPRTDFEEHGLECRRVVWRVETPAEALFLQKPLSSSLCGQFSSNARRGVGPKAFSVPEFRSEAWPRHPSVVHNPHVVDVDYPDESLEVLQQALRKVAVGVIAA